MARVKPEATNRFSKNVYLMRGDAFNGVVPSSANGITWFLVDHTKLDLGHGPFLTKKAATVFGKAQGYTVHGVFPSGIFPGDDED